MLDDSVDRGHRTSDSRHRLFRCQSHMSSKGYNDSDFFSGKAITDQIRKQNLQDIGNGRRRVQSSTRIATSWAPETMFARELFQGRFKRLPGHMLNRGNGEIFSLSMKCESDHCGGREKYTFWLRLEYKK